MHDDEAGAIPQGILKLKIATCCTQSEFALINKINKNKTQEHLVTNQADRRASVKLGATTLTPEHREYPFQKDTNRKDKVKRLIQQFESHPNKQSFLQDLNHTEKINKSSEKSQKLIADMNNTEIFELCETSSKQQCTDCNLYWEIGIVYCTCGRCFKTVAKN